MFGTCMALEFRREVYFSKYSELVQGEIETKLKKIIKPHGFKTEKTNT